MLESIEIENFRSCEKVNLRLGEPLIALIGKNGAGKTNLLHAVQIAAELCVGEPDSIFQLRAQDRSKPVRISIVFVVDGARYRYETIRPASDTPNATSRESLHRGDEEVFLRDGEHLRAPFGQFRAGFRVPIEMGSLFLLTRFESGDPEVTALKSVSAYLRAIRYYPLLHREQEHVERATPPFLETSMYEKWKLMLAAGRPSESVGLRMLHMHLTDQPKFEELRTLLGEDGLGLIDDVRIEEVKINRKRDESSNVVYSMTFVPCAGIAGAGRAFRHSGLSEGTWRVARLLTYLVFDAASCMLVEQPEDSIHAGLLARLVDILQTYSDRTQFICTTHSPRVMNLIGAEGIRIVTAEGGRTGVTELSSRELEASQAYLADEGTLAEFLETL